MNNRWRLGQIMGVEIWFTQESLLLSLLFWIVLSGAAFLGFKMALGTAFLVGLTAVFLHWLSDLLHQLGHAWVARRLGYPMKRLVSWLLLITSHYPRDEPPLHAQIHIKRALGGPAVSLVLTLASGLLLLTLPATQSASYILPFFFFAENLLVFFLGAFLPLGFTDGTTLLTWWPRRHEPLP